MKTAVATFALLLGLAAAAGAATVYVPLDDKPIQVQQADAVRLSGTGIAGAAITAKAQGPATVAEYDVVELKNGKPLIGAARKDFIVRPTGVGKVTVTITVQNPTGGATVTTHEITVK